jgi:hypothetical protein
MLTKFFTLPLVEPGALVNLDSLPLFFITLLVLPIMHHILK